MSHNLSQTSKTKDLEGLRPYFLCMPSDNIKPTLERMTQCGRIHESTYPFKMHYKSPFPASNVARWNKCISTNSVYSDTPGVDDGSICAQLYFGLDTLVTDVYGMKSDA